MKSKELIKKILDKYLDFLESILKKFGNYIKQMMAERAEENRIYKEEYKRHKLNDIRRRARRDATEGKSTFSNIGNTFGDFNKPNESFQNKQPHHKTSLT